jgi:hypothetical protein
MAGQSAGNSISSVMGAINSIKTHGGISDSETSAVGGAGRKGGAAEGPETAKSHRIYEEFKGRMGGEANTGTTGYNSGSGHTS